MNCDKAFDRYLELDKNERVPFAITLHLLVCPACRTGVRSMTKAENRLAAPLSVDSASALRYESAALGATADPVIAAALARIRTAGLEYEPVEHHVSLMRWLVSGLALAAGFAIMPLSFGDWSKAVFGNGYSIAFYLLCGLAVTIYGGLFVGTNIDFFVKKFGFEHSIEHPA